MSRFGGFSEGRVFVETEIYKLRRIAIVHRGRSVRPLDFFKFEVNRAVAVNSSQEKPVDFGARFFGQRRIGWQRVTHSPGGADNPAWQFAAMEFPIVGVED